MSEWIIDAIITLLCISVVFFPIRFLDRRFRFRDRLISLFGSSIMYNLTLYILTFFVFFAVEPYLMQIYPTSLYRYGLLLGSAGALVKFSDQE